MLIARASHARHRPRPSSHAASSAAPSLLRLRLLQRTAQLSRQGSGQRRRHRVANLLVGLCGGAFENDAVRDALHPGVLTHRQRAVGGGVDDGAASGSEGDAHIFVWLCFLRLHFHLTMHANFGPHSNIHMSIAVQPYLVVWLLSVVQVSSVANRDPQVKRANMPCFCASPRCSRMPGGTSSAGRSSLQGQAGGRVRWLGWTAAL